jgi:hypothetical protein
MSTLLMTGASSAVRRLGSSVRVSVGSAEAAGVPEGAAIAHTQTNQADSRALSSTRQFSTQEVVL